MPDVEACSILYFTERRRLSSFLHTVYGLCEGLYSQGSVDGRKEMSDGRLLFPGADQVLMEQAWIGFRERHGSQGLRLSLKGRRRDELARAGLLGTGWRQGLEAVDHARRTFVRDGDEESLRGLILGINGLLDGLLGVAEAGPVLTGLRELMRDLGERRFRHAPATGGGAGDAARSSAGLPAL